MSTALRGHDSTFEPFWPLLTPSGGHATQLFFDINCSVNSSTTDAKSAYASLHAPYKITRHGSQSRGTLTVYDF